MKRKRIIIIVIELVLLIAVMGGVYYYTNSQVVPTKVFVFNRTLETGEVITKDKLAVVELPASAINENFLRSQDLVIGKVVTTDVSKGQFVLTDLVTEQEYLNPIKTMDLSKMRKISFAVEMERTLAGNIKKGDIVDLAYLAVAENKETGQTFIYSKIFMPEVIIWSVNSDDGYEYIPKTVEYNIDGGASSIAGDQLTSMDNSSSGELSSVTVVVTGPQAEEIMARSTAGEIQILGRFSGAEEADSTGFSINTPTSVYSGNVDPENGQIDVENMEDVNTDNIE